MLEVHENIEEKGRNSRKREVVAYLLGDKKMGEFGDASLDKMGGVFDLNQKGSKLRYNSFLTSKHMSIFA